MGKLEWARALALKLLAEFGLSGWDFRYNRRLRLTGLCVYPHKGRPGRIELSMAYVELNDPADIENTIRHEIAHALAGPDAKHGPAWVRMCEVTGARPSRCCTVQMPLGKWRSQCASCQVEFSRFRKPKRMDEWFCRGCGPEKGRLAWQRVG